LVPALPVDHRIAHDLGRRPRRSQPAHLLGVYLDRVVVVEQLHGTLALLVLPIVATGDAEQARAAQDGGLGNGIYQELETRERLSHNAMLFRM
jgi:hypothetical protein